MSSLRPLATITLLAAVGVFLYMKINETEPELPAGVSEWTPDSFEIGDGGDATVAATSPAASSPALPAMSDSGEAPAFTPSAPPKAATPTATPGDTAPPWTPGPLAITEPAAPAASAAPAAKATEESSPVARTAEPPAQPAMPPLPSTGATSSATANSAVPTSPATTTSEPPSTGEQAAAAAAAAVAAAAPAAIAAASQDSSTPVADPAAAPAAQAAAQPSMFAAARVAVQGALDRGELSQALLLLSDWYDDPSLSAAEAQEVESLLGQLAGSVIYEGPPAHRLEKAYIVQAGETLETIAARYDVPWQLLAKINGVPNPNALQPGQELKVVRGPFSALVDLSERRITLMLDRRYAGQFAIDLDPTTSIEEGQWKVDQKLLTPAAATSYGGPTTGSAEDRSLLLASLTNPSGPPAVVRGPGAADPVSAEPKGRTIRLKGVDVNDVYDILSEGSRVTIRR